MDGHLEMDFDLFVEFTILATPPGEHGSALLYGGIHDAGDGRAEPRPAFVLASELRAAVSSPEITVWYQPQLDFRTGEILDESWNLKKTLASNITTDQIDAWYQIAKKSGAKGGKILGAGAGGFLMFYADEDHHEAIAVGPSLPRGTESNAAIDLNQLLRWAS